MAEKLVRSRLSGTLDFESVPRVWPSLAEKIRASRRLEVSLEGVEKSNSAALALLLQGLELARRSGCELRYKEIPPPLLALARMSNVERLLLGQGAVASE